MAHYVSNKYPLVHSDDGSFSLVVDDGVFRVITILTLNDVLLVSKFLVSLLSVSKLPKKKLFFDIFPIYLCFLGPP